MNAHTIDHTKGEMIGTVSAQWANRPEDQRFTSLGDLRDQVNAWAEASFIRDVTPGSLKVTADAGQLWLTSETENLGHIGHNAFSQLARIASAPASYLRTLHPTLAGLNLSYGLRAAEQKESSLYLRSEGVATHLRGVTSTKYGRIFDRDVVDAVMQIAGQGTGDTRWKVPGCIEWGGTHGVKYNPNVNITKENTTLYASDRDLFLFLVDDMNPIEVGKLDNGDPDLLFRGFYTWNSEVGERTFGVATMYLRGVCMNRNLWGVEGFTETTFRHTAGAPDRFLKEGAPALATFAETNTTALIEGVTSAKSKKVSSNGDERLDFLVGLGFSVKRAKELVEIAMVEEGRPPESLWDHAQAISAAARKLPYQDERVKLEKVAGKVLDLAV